MRPASTIIARTALASIDMLTFLSSEDRDQVREEVASAVRVGSLSPASAPTSGRSQGDPTRTRREA